MRIPASAFELIRGETERAYPHECCGALLGRLRDGAAREVVRVVPLANARASERERRYLIEPGTIRALDEQARADGLEILGFYHSHPEHAPLPSAFDGEHAWPWYTYLIVAVRNGVAGEARAWVLAGDRTRFQAEELVILQEAT
ncbi:MAG: M67 family metallopeptidase [Gemmatimonadetes bacterium]|nr:M67 family metallopeptidase [Gemmatimonadota bacterium]